MNELKDLLLSNGADLVGFANLHGISINEEMPFGVSVAVKLSPELIKSIHDGPNMFYYEEYHRINNILDNIVTIGADYLIKNGYKAFAQTKNTITYDTKWKSKLPHKTVATRAGLGWVGKCALLVTKEYGSGIRISSLVTNAQLDCGTAIEESLCGDCMECVNNCAGDAVFGKIWNVNTETSDLMDIEKCGTTGRDLVKNKINKDQILCGKCIYVCPYTKKYING